MNKKSLMWIVPLMCVAIVSGAWLFSITGGFDFIVESLPGYAIIDIEFPTLNINTTNGVDSDTKEITFLINKDMNVSISIDETYQDNSGGLCIGGEDDCEIIYQIETGRFNPNIVEISNGEIIDLTAMSSSRILNATMTCQAYSCPQSRSIEINLVEVIQ